MNAAEEAPQLARACGSACDRGLALALRPIQKRGVLVLMCKRAGERF